MKWLRLVVAFLACVTSQAVHVFAQTGPDAGGLTGVITDELGAGLPDATIAVSGPALIGTRSGRTAAGGVYRIFPLHSSQ